MNGQCAFEAGGCPAAGAPPEHAACSPDLAVLLNDPVLSFGFNVPDTAAARAGRADNALPPAHPAADQENFNLLELHGDEQTWDLEDWNWDANALEASRKLAGAAPVYPDPSMQCQSAGAAPCSFAMPTGMQHCHNAVSHLGKLQACSGADDSPFMQASAADLGLAAAHKGGCSEGDACCDEPDAKRARHAAGCGCDNQAELDAAIANGAVVIHSKPPATDTENMVCQVPGCGKDLGCMKEYHQRYRVCETHIRLPAIVKDGRLQRFCQQCGRFHPLVAFDGARKSCREQLNKHNARRRRRSQMEARKAKAPLDETSGDLSCMAGGASALDGQQPLKVASGGDPSDRPPSVGPRPDAPATNGPPELARLLTGLMQNPQQLQALRLLLGVKSNAALPTLKPFEPFDCPVCEPDKACSGASSAGDPVSYALARDISQGKGEFAPAYASEHRSLRISMKLFNRTPADLPPDLRQQVTSWLAEVPPLLEGYIRPGCVHLTLHALVGRHAYDAAAKAGVQDLVRHLLRKTGCAFWRSGSYAVQLFGKVAVVTDGRVRTIADYEDASSKSAARAPPQLKRLCVVGRGSCGTKLAWSCESDSQVSGGVLQHSDGVQVHCCFRGRQARVQLRPDARGGNTRVSTVRHLHGCGVATVECSRGVYAYPPRPLLVVDSDELAMEVQQLSDCVTKPSQGSDNAQDGRARWSLDQAQVDAVLVDLGLVLSHLGGNDGHVDVLPLDMMCLKARRLLAFACDMGWYAVAQRVLPLAMRIYGNASSTVDAVDAAVPCGGLSLLHRAARSGSLPLVHGMLHWGFAHGYAWRADRAGPGGLTPLHLAALHDDVRIAVLLLDHCPPSAYTRLVATDGVTPFHLAFQMGHFNVTSLMNALQCSLRSSAKPDEDQAVLHAHVKVEPAYDSDPAQVDACEHCHSTLPPLMLNVEAACTDCSEPRPCILEAGEDMCDEMCYGTRGGVVPSATCAHAHGNVYHVTAMCQSCHINRSLVTT